MRPGGLSPRGGTFGTEVRTFAHLSRTSLPKQPSQLLKDPINVHLSINGDDGGAGSEFQPIKIII